MQLLFSWLKLIYINGVQWKVPLIVEVYLLTKVIVSAWQEPLYAFYLSVFYPNAQISLLTLTYIFSFFLFILLCNGHIERNPGPQKLKQNSPSICHWNLSSLSANNFSKLTQLKAYNSVYKHHFICFSETYLDSATPKNLLKLEVIILSEQIIWIMSKEVKFVFTYKK